MHPVVSIVVPAFNGVRFLEAALRSIARQTFTHFECLIVDDGSTDGTSALAEKFAASDARFRCVIQPHAGVAEARNHGFRLSDPSAQLLVFMDADDVWMDDSLQSLVAVLEKNPQAVGAHGLADLIDADGKPMDFFDFTGFGRRRIGFDGRRIVDVDPARPSTFETVLYSSKIYPPGVLMLRRWAIEKAGLFDANLGGVEDWDLVIRVARFGELSFLNRVILHYRRHDGNMTNGMAPNIATRIHYKAFFSSANNESQRQTVRKGWRAWQIFKIREKLVAAGRKLRQGDLKGSAMMAGHVAGHCYRYLLGQPTL
jgi:glycosyltransferase involved in cell wall biosynthesis